MGEDSKVQTTDAANAAAPVQTAPNLARRRLLLVLILVCLTLGGGTAYYVWLYALAPAIPTLRLDGLEPQVKQAVEAASEAVRGSPRSAKAWGNLGMVLLAHRFREGEPEACFAQAEKLDPADARWPYFQGMQLYMKDGDAAIQKFERAVALTGDEPDAARLWLAETCLLYGRQEEAAAHYQRLVQLQPSHPVAHLGLARVAFERGEFSASLEHLQRCAGSPFTQKAAHDLMAGVYRRLQDPKAADRQLQLADGYPKDANWPNPYGDGVVQLAVDRRSRLDRAAQLLDQKRVSEALAAFEQVVHEYPEWELGWSDFGAALLQLGDHARAEQTLQKAVQLAPDAVDAQFYLGCARFSLGNYSAALGSFRRAAELKPDHALALYNLGHCFKQQGDQRAAIEAFRSALRSKPYLARVHRDLGELLGQNGQKAEAREHLRLATELNPSDEKAGKLLEQMGTPEPVPNKPT